MPVYEYKCNACGREFEVQQRMSDPELTDCEVCGKPALERLISRTAFTLKGGGWYKDLYSSTKPESKSTETKTESKSEGAAAPAPAASSSSDSGSSSSSGSTSSSSGTSSGSGGGGSSGSKAAASAS
ncbi:MAG: zinc ribbon domain-containing protein [Deltaproteobacteria bacterium]|nr:zinc ribbon domain-containing protein [Deltaproteobacteria bacterium]